MLEVVKARLREQGTLTGIVLLAVLLLLLRLAGLDLDVLNAEATKLVGAIGAAAAAAKVLLPDAPKLPAIEGVAAEIVAAPLVTEAALTAETERQTAALVDKLEALRRDVARLHGEGPA